LKPVCVLESNYRVDAGASAVREVLSHLEIPTVVFCGNDLIAMGAMSAREESGVRVPKDVSVIGMDDIFFACLARPPLTTISVPREQLGVKAFEELDRMLELKRHKGSSYMLETDLVVRKCTAPVRRQTLRVNSYRSNQIGDVIAQCQLTPNIGIRRRWSRTRRLRSELKRMGRDASTGTTLDL
jgi:hypothetical protein